MENYVLLGTIYGATCEAMDELMRAVLGDIQTRSKLIVDDIIFENEAMRLFCTTSNGREWSLNADFKGALSDLTALLSRLTRKLIDAGFNYSFGYYQIDESGNEVGEEVSLYHPDFWTHGRAPAPPSRSPPAPREHTTAATSA